MLLGDLFDLSLRGRSDAVGLIHDGPDGVARELLSFRVAQPWDLADGRALQTRAELTWNLDPVTTGALWSALLLTESEPRREVGARARARVAPGRSAS